MVCCDATDHCHGVAAYRELVARANRGDGEAAYYRYRIQQTCAYPRNQDNPKPVAADSDPDAWRTQQHSRKLQRADKACPPELQGILATQDAALWLKMAADLGYPLAQAMIASRLLDGNRNREDTESARQFMRTAARSRDPDVLLEIARNIPALVRSFVCNPRAAKRCDPTAGSRTPCRRQVLRDTQQPLHSPIN